MGMYRLGDIIRMTRKSLNITQEQLSEGICCEETLSRIETGRQKPSRDTYELLMERMGRIRERAYSMLSISDFKVLDKMKQFEDYIILYDYNHAEIVLKEIRKILGNTILDKQFLIRAESLVNYRLKRIDTEAFLEGLQKAILLTIPRYGVISLSNWPLNHYEATLLLNISTAYAEKKDYSRAIRILEETNSAMKQSYIDVNQRAAVQAIIANNLSKWYGLVGDHEKAIKIANEGIALCKKYRLGSVLSNLMYSVAWNTEQLINSGVLSSDHQKECLACLKQSYYIASAMQQLFVAQFVAKHITTYYNTQSDLLNN